MSRRIATSSPDVVLVAACPAYHRLLKSVVMPRRNPCGLTFWPTIGSLPSNARRAVDRALAGVLFCVDVLLAWLRGTGLLRGGLLGRWRRHSRSATTTVMWLVRLRIAVRAALRARPDPLQRRALVDVRLADPRATARSRSCVVLGVRDRATSAPCARARCAACGANRSTASASSVCMPADEVDDAARLLGADVRTYRALRHGGLMRRFGGCHHCPCYSRRDSSVALAAPSARGRPCSCDRGRSGSPRTRRACARPCPRPRTP